jgi:cellulose synthase (UDP-forming)
MYADSDALPRFLISRRRYKNMLLGLAQFIYWGVSEPARAISYALRKARAGEAPTDSVPQVSTLWLRRLLALMRVRAAADDRPRGQSGAA